MTDRIVFSDPTSESAHGLHGPLSDTVGGEAGSWERFERTYTTADAAIDSIQIRLGFGGCSGNFRVDDVRVEPAG